MTKLNLVTPDVRLDLTKGPNVTMRPITSTATTELLAEMDAAVAQVQQISGLTGEDDAVAALIGDSESDTAGALSASYGLEIATPGSPANAAIAARDARNILDYGVVRGTSASQTVAIKAAFDAHPGDAFYFPPGNYRLDTSLVVASNPLHLAPGARLYAGAALDTLVDWDNGAVSVSNYAQDAGIFGAGLIDGNLLAKKALAIGSVIRFTLQGLTIKDPLYRGLWLKPNGAEVIGQNLRFHNTGITNAGRSVSVTTSSGSAGITGTGFTADEVGCPIFGAGIPAGTTILSYTSATAVTMSATATASGTVTAQLPNNIAIEADMGDVQFSDVITRDFTVGLWDKGNHNKWALVHPWIGTTTQLTARYPISRAFIVGKTNILDRPYADTYRYNFTGWMTPGFSLGYSMSEIKSPDVYCNTGNLTDALALANPGVVFDLTSADRFDVTGGDYRGHPVTPHVFVQGDTTRLSVTRAKTSTGGVTSISDRRAGVRLNSSIPNVAPFARIPLVFWTPTLYGSTTAGVTSYTTQSGTSEIRDGIVTHRFRIVGTFGTAGNAPAGNLRIGNAPYPTGAASVSIGHGGISRRTGFATAAGVAGANGTGSLAPLVVYTESGAEIAVVAGQAFEIYGEVSCPFTYPS